MALTLPDLRDLKNESDVEQKFVYPILTAARPDGLGFAVGDIQTKANIRRFKIDKGGKEKLYYPDYIVALGGYPLLVIEVKGLGEDLVEAYREARLYAAELNAVYPSGTNPAGYLIVTDGEKLLAGPWDSDKADIQLDRSTINPYSQGFADFIAAASKGALETKFKELAKRVYPATLKKPRQSLGGVSVQNEEIGHNSFGATLSSEFGHIFNPISRDDRAFVARHAYVSSKRRERYIDPIDRVIRASRPPSEIDARKVEDTADPKEVVGVFRDPKPLEHQVLLVVGSVGSGKSTFVDYLQEMALPKEVMESTVWVRINMNAAPISNAEIYDWLRTKIVSGCQAAYSDKDFDSLEVLKKLFGPQVKKFHKGTGQLYSGNENLYKQKLAELIDSLNGNLHEKAVAMSRYCATERAKLLVMVLDNSDKRLRDEQLLMFQAAQWLQREFRALVILPLREETYDNHRDQPPLDTALKNLVFRIEPPLFQHVLVTRVQLTMNELAKSGERTFTYDLPNGFHVEYAASDQAFYLSSIIRSIFEHDRYIRRMMVGLAGRNMRKALEIFLEFCTSGHIGEDQIFRIRQNSGQYTLPLHLVMRVLLRMNRRYYNSDFSYLKNLFAASRYDVLPNYFTSLMILRWLNGRINVVGPSGLKGYFPIGRLKQEIIPMGVPENAIDRELEGLVKAQCVITEDLRTEALTDEILVRLASPGFVHLEMIGSIDYLAAVAEDTWFFDASSAEHVARRITQLESQYEADTALANARELVQFLVARQENGVAAPSAFLDPNTYSILTDLTPATEAIQRATKAKVNPRWLALEKRYAAGTEVESTVVNKKVYGVFVELEPGVTGLIHRSRLPQNFESSDIFTHEEEVIVRVRHLDPVLQRIELEYVGQVPVTQSDMFQEKAS